MTAVFANTDGTDYPLQTPGWTVQSTPAPASVYAGLTTNPFKGSVAGTNGTPSNAFGWTVRSVGTYAS